MPLRYYGTERRSVVSQSILYAFDQIAFSTPISMHAIVWISFSFRPAIPHSPMPYTSIRFSPVVIKLSQQGPFLLRHMQQTASCTATVVAVDSSFLAVSLLQLVYAAGLLP